MNPGRLSFAAFAAALTFGCDTYGPVIEPPLPSWTGEYTVRADTVRYCTENQTPLSGHFWRADGNVRGCGADSGPFTATKK